MICRVDRKDFRSSAGMDCMADMRGLRPGGVVEDSSPNAGEKLVVSERVGSAAYQMSYRHHYSYGLRILKYIN